MSDLSERFVASTARALNSAQVPCVLWGHYLLNVHGVPSIIASIDFVVPDDRLRTAAEALSRIQSLTPCPDCETCPASSPRRPSPPPAYHLHIEATEETVELFPQSDTLWFLPPLDDALVDPKKGKLPWPFALASDKTLPPRRLGRGTGAFVSDEDPVVVLKSHVLLEACMRLFARDADKTIGGISLVLVAYIWEYVDGDGFLNPDLLPELFRASYKELKEGKPIRPWSDKLMADLGVLDDKVPFT